MSQTCQQQSFRFLAANGAVVARQCNDELSKCAGLSVDIDLAAMLLDNDIMCHRQAEPCPFPGWFGGEEGIEHLRSHFGRDAGAVVANPDFVRFALASYRGIKPIRDKV